MDLNADDFERLIEFPAHVLTVKDALVVWVDLDDQPSYVGMVLRLKHPDMYDSYDQLYRLRPPFARRLASMLIDHSEPPPVL